MNDSLLPKNATPLMRDLEHTADRITGLEILVKNLRDPDRCPAHILPWLGWALSVDVWDDVWPESIKRQVIKDSIFIHQRKGTLGAIKRALATFNFENVTIKEWFEYNGRPYTFKVLLDFKNTAAPLNSMKDALAVINDAKNLRSHLDALEISISTVSEVPRMAIVATCGEIVYVYPKA